jgi:hypothetical protein
MAPAPMIPATILRLPTPAETMTGTTTKMIMRILAADPERQFAPIRTIRSLATIVVLVETGPEV